MSVLYHTSPFQSHLYNPSSPSPLAPLHLNVRLPTTSLFSAHSMSKQKSSLSIALKHAREHPRQRVATSTRDPAKDRDLRRTTFLRSVKERSGEKRHEARSELMVRSDVLAQQRAWEQALEREAASGPALEEEDMDDFDEESYLVEDFAVRDDQEIEALAAMADSRSEQTRETLQDEYECEMSDYGSDDDEYDALLVQALQDFEKQRSSQEIPLPSQDDHCMDMSLG